MKGVTVEHNTSYRQIF